MSAFLKANANCLFGESHGGRGVDEVAENVSRLGRCIAVGDFLAQEPIKAAGHEGKLQIAVHLDGDGGRQGVDVEEINAVCYPIFDEHTLGVALHQLSRRAPQLIGE